MVDYIGGPKLDDVRANVITRLWDHRRKSLFYCLGDSLLLINTQVLEL